MSAPQHAPAPAPTGADNIVCRVPAALRDADGVRLEQALTEAGARIIRELPRAGLPAGWVDLLLEHTSAPAAVRGMTVTPEIEAGDYGAGAELVCDGWRPWRDEEPYGDAVLYVRDIAEREHAAQAAQQG